MVCLLFVMVCRDFFDKYFLMLGDMFFIIVNIFFGVFVD